ncbi:hypothetical protein D9M68_809040 [compost metagenome]
MPSTVAGEEIIRQTLGRLRPNCRWACRGAVADQFISVGTRGIQQLRRTRGQAVDNTQHASTFGIDLLP